MFAKEVIISWKCCIAKTYKKEVCDLLQYLKTFGLVLRKILTFSGYNYGMYAISKTVH